MLGLSRGNFSSQPEAAEFCRILVKKCHEDQDPQLMAAAVRATAPLRCFRMETACSWVQVTPLKSCPPRFTQPSSAAAPPGLLDVGQQWESQAGSLQT